jgi:hypothetical protein
MGDGVRRAEGRIAAWRCLEASRIAVDDRTRDALERCAVRYMLKAIGIDARDEVAERAHGSSPGPASQGLGGGLTVWLAEDDGGAPGPAGGATGLGRFTRPAVWK